MLRKNHFHIRQLLTRAKIIVSGLCILLCRESFAQVISNNGLTISNSSGIIVKADTINNNAGGTLTNAGTLNLLTLNNSGTALGSGTYNISKSFTSPGTFIANSSTVNFTGNSNQLIPAISFANVAFSGTGSRKTAAGDITVNGSFSIVASDTLNMGIATFSGTPTSVSGTGSLLTQSTATYPIPAGISWTGPVFYNSIAAQNIVPGNYTDLNATGGNRTVYAGITGIAGLFTPGSGSFISTGSTINFNGGTAQTVPAFDFYSVIFSGGSSKSMAGNATVTDSLSVGSATTLSLGASNITIRSSATAVGRVAYMPASATVSYGTGRFIIERYVPGRRKYRLLTPAVSSSPNATLSAGEEALSICGNWQNQGDNTTANKGTIITGGNSTDGFDTQTPNASLYTYNDAARVYTKFSSANGNTTKYTPLKAGVAYYLFIYGDRTNTITTSSPKNTVITSTGKILTGDQLYTTSSTLPLTPVTGRFTFLGNPFASPINWATITKTNLDDTYWGWDPNLSSTGGYITVNSTGSVTLQAPYSGSTGLNQYIQPGQGFFVKTNAASPTMTIREQDKVSNFNSNAFRMGDRTASEIALIAVNLQYANGAATVLADGALAAFDPSFTNQPGTEDAEKLQNSNEAISISNSGQSLSIDKRQLPRQQDTLFLATARLTRPQYTLQVFAQQLQGSGITAFLEDTYLDNRQALSLADTNFISFSVTPGDPASAGPNRFRIVFVNTQQSLPLHFISVVAVRFTSFVQTTWQVADADGTKSFTVERSADGSNFSRLDDLAAAGGNNGVYNWKDMSPLAGIAYYRIRATEFDGHTELSKIVTVNPEQGNAPITIYPNPVTGQHMSIRSSSLRKGVYALLLHNRIGQEVMRLSFIHPGGAFHSDINLPVSLAPGTYYLKLKGDNLIVNQSILVE
jgi:hypothetical protein